MARSFLDWLLGIPDWDKEQAEIARFLDALEQLKGPLSPSLKEFYARMYYGSGNRRKFVQDIIDQHLNPEPPMTENERCASEGRSSWIQDNCRVRFW